MKWWDLLGWIERRWFPRATMSPQHMGNGDWLGPRHERLERLERALDETRRDAEDLKRGQWSRRERDAWHPYREHEQ